MPDNPKPPFAVNDGRSLRIVAKPGHPAAPPKPPPGAGEAGKAAPQVPSEDAWGPLAHARAKRRGL